MKSIDLTGRIFGHLTVLQWTRKAKNGQSYWECQCECGTKRVVNGGSLIAGQTLSCGCLHRFLSGLRRRTHGESKNKQCKGTKEYRAWRSMIERCTRKNSPKYKDYGGRGIYICSEWLASYERFLSDVGRAPEPRYSLDRIDVNGDYEPSNVCWSTPVHQTLNRRTSKRHTIGWSAGLLGFSS